MPNWTPLQQCTRDIRAEIRRRGESFPQALLKVGGDARTVSTVREWLRRPGSYLRHENGAKRSAHLCVVAALLGIKLDEAIRLQGGTGEGRLKQLVSAMSMKPEARRPAFSAWSELQIRYQRAYSAHGFTMRRQAADWIGVPYHTLSDFERHPGHRLKLGALRRVADFLGVDYAEAIQLQGGTWKDGQAERARTVLQPALRAWRSSHRAAFSEAQRKASRGKPKSKSSNRKRSKSLKAFYREHPDSKPRSEHMKGDRGIVLGTYSALKRHRPGLSEQHYRNLTVDRVIERYPGRFTKSTVLKMLHRRHRLHRGGRKEKWARWELSERLRQQRLPPHRIAQEISKNEGKEITVAAYTRWRRGFAKRHGVGGNNS